MSECAQKLTIKARRHHGNFEGGLIQAFGKKLQDPPFVFSLGESVHIHMGSAVHQPELLRFGGGIEQSLRLWQRGVAVGGAGDEKFWDGNFADVPNRFQIVQTNSKPQLQLARQKWRRWFSQ